MCRSTCLFSKKAEDEDEGLGAQEDNEGTKGGEEDILRRLRQLEALTSKQQVDIRKVSACGEEEQGDERAVKVLSLEFRFMSNASTSAHTRALLIPNPTNQSSTLSSFAAQEGERRPLRHDRVVYGPH